MATTNQEKIPKETLESIREIITLKEAKDVHGLGVIYKDSILHVMDDSAEKQPDGSRVLVVRVDNGTDDLELMAVAYVRDYDVLGTPEFQMETYAGILRDAQRDIKSLHKQRYSSSYKSLSKYSKELHEAEERKAVSRQMDAIMGITNLVMDKVLTQKEAEALVRKALK